MSFQPLPPGLDLSADQGNRIIGSGVTLIILPTIFVILRFISRYVSRAGYWWDDLLVLASLFLTYGPCICIIVSQKINDFGKHLWALPDPEKNTRVFLKILYVYIIFYYTAVVTVKLAILTFYRRIFPITEIRIWLYIGYAVVGMYAIATLCATTFQCQPIHAFWDFTMKNRHCVSGDNILIVPGSINAVLDATIVAIPIPLLWRLRTTTYQKGVLTGIFLCASFVCIISVIRLIVLSRLEAFDVTWNYVNAAIWSAAEPAMGVIAACLPSLRPLVALVWKGSHRGPTYAINSTKSAQAATSSSSKTLWSVKGDREDADKNGMFTRLEDGNGRWGHNADIKGGRGGVQDDVSLEELNPQDGVIRVKKEVVITTENWGYNDRVF